MLARIVELQAVLAVAAPPPASQPAAVAPPPMPMPAPETTSRASVVGKTPGTPRRRSRTWLWVTGGVALAALDGAAWVVLAADGPSAPETDLGNYRLFDP